VWYGVGHDVDDGFGDVPSCFGVGFGSLRKGGCFEVAVASTVWCPEDGFKCGLEMAEVDS